MASIFILITAVVISGFLTWRSERRRTPDRALRKGFGAAVQLLCIVGLGVAGEYIAFPDHPTLGFTVGALAGVIIAIIVQKLFDWSPKARPRS